MPKENRPHERLRAMIREARVVASNPDSAPAVASALLGGPLWDAILADTDVHRLVMSNGLNAAIRAALAHYHTEAAEGAREMKAKQIEMWPADVRALVAQIDRERVFVPSREEFVELVPGAMTPSEMREAGEYLVGHGEDCIRRGQTLVRLAGRISDPPKECAA